MPPAGAEADAEGSGDVAALQELYPLATKGVRNGREYFGRLPYSTKFVFAFSMFGWHALRFMKTGHMKKFYTDDYPGASLSVMSTFIILAPVLDVFFDPLVSVLTDNTRRVFGKDRGRRRPFLFACAFLAVIICPLAYAPPASLSSAGSAAWYGVLHVLFQVVLTSVRDIPHFALGSELTCDYQERTSLWAQWELWSVIGILVGLLLPTLSGDECSGSPEDGCTSFLMLAMAFAVIFFFSSLLLVCKVKERPTASLVKQNSPLVATLVQSMMNKPFWLLLMSDVVEGFGSNLPMQVLPYITEWVIGAEACKEFIGSPSLFFGLMVSVHMIVRLPSTFLWKWIADRFGKFRTFLLFNVLFGVQHLAFLIVGEGDTMLAMVLTATWGFCYAGHWLMRDIASDVFDYGELLNGERREGHFAMTLELIPKLIEVPADALPMILMGYFQYDPALDRQSDGVRWTLRMSLSVVPGLAGLFGALVLLRFPLRTKEQHAAIIRGIAAHKAGLPATDPLTGLELPVQLRKDDGTVVFGGEELRGDHALILGHFFAFEVQLAITAGDVSKLRVMPLIAAVSSMLLFVPGVLLFISGWEDLARGDAFSWSNVGLIVCGFSIIFFAFSAVRLREAQRAVRQGLPLSACQMVANIYASQGLLRGGAKSSVEQNRE